MYKVEKNKKQDALKTQSNDHRVVTRGQKLLEFSYNSKTMANLEAFCWHISSSIISGGCNICCSTTVFTLKPSISSTSSMVLTNKSVPLQKFQMAVG